MAGHLKPDHLLNVNPQQFINPTTKEASYILGLLWADGYIIKYNHRIGIDCVTTDAIQYLQIFQKLGKWTTYNFQRKSRKPAMLICTHSKKLYTFMEDNDYGIKSTASPTKILQIIPQSLHHYFWHGYFDGDGSLWISKNGYQRQLSLCGSFEQNWTDAIKLLNILDIVYHNHVVNASCKCSNLRITNKNGIIKFTDYIYQDKTLVGLTRKHACAQLINCQV